MLKTFKKTTRPVVHVSVDVDIQHNYVGTYHLIN